MPPRRGRFSGPLTNAALACPGRTSDRGGAAVARAGGAVLGRRLRRDLRGRLYRARLQRALRATHEPEHRALPAVDRPLPPHRLDVRPARRQAASGRPRPVVRAAARAGRRPVAAPRDDDGRAGAGAGAVCRSRCTCSRARAAQRARPASESPRRGWSQRRHRVSRTAGSHPNTSSRCWPSRWRWRRAGARCSGRSSARNYCSASRRTRPGFWPGSAPSRSSSTTAGSAP